MWSFAILWVRMLFWVFCTFVKQGSFWTGGKSKWSDVTWSHASSIIHPKLHLSQKISKFIGNTVNCPVFDQALNLQGKTFSIWKLNDLHNLEVFVSLLLFGEVHKEHWKTEPGTVIGLLNPNPMKQKDGYDGVSGRFEQNIPWFSIHSFICGGQLQYEKTGSEKCCVSLFAHSPGKWPVFHLWWSDNLVLFIFYWTGFEIFFCHWLVWQQKHQPIKAENRLVVLVKIASKVSGVSIAWLTEMLREECGEESHSCSQ